MFKKSIRERLLCVFKTTFTRLFSSMGYIYVHLNSLCVNDVEFFCILCESEESINFWSSFLKNRKKKINANERGFQCDITKLPRSSVRYLRWNPSYWILARFLWFLALLSLRKFNNPKKPKRDLHARTFRKVKVCEFSTRQEKNAFLSAPAAWINFYAGT